MQIRRGGIGLLTAVVLFFVLAATSFAQETGGITGTVTDSVTGLPMAGAKVSVDGTPLNVQTDRQGKFTLVAVPSGEISITITYLGYADKTVTTNVGLDAFSSVSVELESSVREVVEVSAPILEGQAKALNQQKEAVNITNVVSSDQIGRFPDPNSAEATQRIPGITIERDQGEGRYVSIRGTEPRLNAMMIDGERIPSPEGDIRAVALDVVPADLLEAIEVTKAPTADMWADSIGGSVNLVTKGAPSKTKVSLTAGWGYNRVSEDDLQTFNGTVGSRFFNDKLGALFSASYFNTDRGSENFEVEYDDGDLDALELRDYSINRKRWGFVPAFDYAFSPTSSIYFKGIYNQFDDYEYRRAIAYKVSDNEIERELKDRFEGQTIYQAKVGGDHLLPNFIRLDWGASIAFSDEEEPDAAYSIFLQEDVVFDPNVSPGSINPENIQANPLNEDFNEYFFDGASNENNVTTDRDVAFRFNVSMPMPTSSGFAGVFKFGAADRYKKKFRNVQVREFEFDDDDDAPVFVNVLDSSFDTTTIIDGRYNFRATFQDPTAARAILTNPNAESEFDLEEDAADYRASENVFAAYAMTQLNIGEKLVLVPGIRFERTDIDYVGNEVLFDDEGDYVSTLAIPGENSFNNYFASVHAKYRFTDKTNFRA
ncbi:MAG: TonB-dependent receptor plug domain-containing protein, partial [Aridibacter famidurans]|nr:TonB-dependent receptor plug domain-containing protein [Aridibacter famidurans]